MAETGHAINVAHLHKCTGFASGWGSTKYKPSNPLIKAGAMDTTATAGDAVLDDVQAAETPYRNSTGTAETLFAQMSPLVRRVMKIAKSSGVPAAAIEDAKTYSRKILGTRATTKVKDDPNTPVDESKESVSASQMSRTQRIEHLDSLISLFESQPLYAPNESELTTAGLTTYSQACKDAVDAITSTFVPFSNELSVRDEKLYINPDAVVPVGEAFRNYVEGVFTRNSNEWNQIKGLKFRDLRRTKK